MASRAQLEAFTDKLEQACAVLDFSGAPGRQLAEARSLVGPLSGDEMPTDGARSLRVQVTESMLRLGTAWATPADLQELRALIHRLRLAIRAYLDVS
jgi:hypothetical protein